MIKLSKKFIGLVDFLKKEDHHPLICYLRISVMRFHGERLDPINVEAFISNIFGDTQHAKRVKSIANAALGVIESASLFVHKIGRGLAKVLNLSDKHAVKQIDRLLSNSKLKIEDTDKSMISFVVGDRREIKVTLD